VQAEKNETMKAVIACIAGLAGLLIGYNTADIAPALDFITQDFQLGPVMQGVVVSSVLAGGFVGSLVRRDLGQPLSA
jgi:MFS family permease